jgi:hypothetical protein
MHADLEHLVKLLKGVQDIRETVRQYTLQATPVAMSIDDLKYSFEQMDSRLIKIGSVGTSKEELARGICLPYEKEVVILLDGSMTPFMNRFVAVKEMCSLILKDDQYLTPDAAQLVSVLVSEYKKPTDGEAPDYVVADAWAEVAATELLFPFDVRNAAIEELKAKTTTLFALSEAYQIPERIIEDALAQEHHEMCNAAWQKITAAKAE